MTRRPPTARPTYRIKHAAAWPAVMHPSRHRHFATTGGAL
jgi:hypothetical protein